MTNEDLVKQLLTRYRHSRAWDAKRGVGTFLTIEIGEEVKPGTGQLHVWVQYAAWSFEFEGHPISSSNSSHAGEYAEALAKLEGQRLEDISVRQGGDGLEVVVSFSNDLVLRMNSDPDNYEDEDDLVSFFDTDVIVSVSVAGGVYAEPPE